MAMERNPTAEPKTIMSLSKRASFMNSSFPGDDETTDGVHCSQMFTGSSNHSVPKVAKKMIPSVCFIFSLAMTGRQILKYLELKGEGLSR